MHELALATVPHLVFRDESGCPVRVNRHAQEVFFTFELAVRRMPCHSRTYALPLYGVAGLSQEVRVWRKNGNAIDDRP